MRVRRGFLFWGIFFVLLGGIPLAVRAGWIDATRLHDAQFLWPLIIIAIGVAILVSRSRAAAMGTIVAALVVGGLAGGALASSGDWIFRLGDCIGSSSGNLQHTSQNGSLSAGASVDLHFSCGTLTVSPRAGQTWTLDAAYRGPAPTVDAGPGDLSVRAPDNGLQHQEWTVALPTEALRDVTVHTDAGQTSLDLSGTRLSSLDVEANAGDVKLIAAGASIDDIDVSINAGTARLTIGGPVSGSLSVNAGSIEMCVPSNADLQIGVAQVFGFDTNLDRAGLVRNGDSWRRAGTGGPSIHLRVEGSAASFTLNPSGGCQ